MIPKIIHYCWFGKEELSDLAKKCILSWKKYMPDCEIKEWNEDNFDVNMIQYTKEAYKHRKYAFVSDFARFYILKQHGGIYLDVDVEIIKPFDDLLEHKTILGFESVGRVGPGLILASEPDTLFLNDMIELYKGLSFIDEKGNMNLTSIVTYTTEYLKTKGLREENVKQEVCGVTIFPTEYFCPINMNTNELIITDNTYSIHHFASSWISNWGKFKKIIRKIIGGRIYYRLFLLKKKIKSYLITDKLREKV